MQSRLSRREWLAALAAAGASAVFPSDPLRAQTQAATNPRRLDLHHHFGSPRWIKRAVEVKRQGWQQFQDYTLAKAIELMDKGGVQTAFVSWTEPGIWFGDDFSKERREAIAMARDMNEYGARMMSDYKGHFGLFAVLPLPDIDASLEEISYAFDTLKADGVGLLTSYGDIWLGDDKLRPVFEELNRRGAIVYTHPTDATCCHNLGSMNPVTVEWLSDTGRSIHSVLNEAPPYSGPPIRATAGGGNVSTRTSAATRYPNVKFVWSHAGGSLISIPSRVVGNISTEALAKPAAPNSKLFHIRRFYYDTAGSTNPILMQGG